MTTQDIVSLALSIFDNLLQLVSASVGRFSEDDAATVKAEILAGILARAEVVAAQDAREWAIVRGEQE